jgi:dsRNA-specific ribonuclease
LNYDNAVSHLHHFCATLPASPYVDLRPDIYCEEEQKVLTRAKVILPLSVDASVREFQGRKAWKAERNAIRDVAFEAYLALYQAGLINENMLPLLRHKPEDKFSEAVEKRAALKKVLEQFDPWIDICKAWASVETHEGLHSSLVKITDTDRNIISEMVIKTPVEMPETPATMLYWDAKTILMVSTTPTKVLHGDPHRNIAPHDVMRSQKFTQALLSAGFGHRFTINRTDFHILFQPKTWDDMDTDSWVSMPLTTAKQLAACDHEPRLIRDNLDNCAPYFLLKWLDKLPEDSKLKYPSNQPVEDPDTPHLVVTKLSRRSDFLHPIADAGLPPSQRVLPVMNCMIDGFPFKHIQFALLIPSILHLLEVRLVAHKLSTTILKNVGLKNIELLATAISSSVARERTNYQRLEFLGDSCLKLCATVQLLADKPTWHEGLLSDGKDRLVANSRLARAAVDLELAQFILTTPFTGQKWRPSYIEELLKQKSYGTRVLSTKVLADVIEAILGAAVLEGGIPKVLSCLRIFLPEVYWQPLEAYRLVIRDLSSPAIGLPSTLEPLEDLIGYKFERKVLLIEAMTHASSTSGTATLERLEFLGDSVLDNIVTMALFKHASNIPNDKMHLIRTALVNADFLAFLCMEWTIEQEKTSIIEQSSATNSDSEPTFSTTSTNISFPLWRFMRCTPAPDFIEVRARTVARHAELRSVISAAIHSGSHYPWALLSRLEAPKYLSDLMESVLGAIYIDSGSFSECQKVLERIGVMSYMQRIVADRVEILHPKQELGMLANTQKVRYVLDSKGGDEVGKFSCEVLIAGHMVVKVGDGVSREEAMTRGAEMAVKELRDWAVKKRAKARKEAEGSKDCS